MALNPAFGKRARDAKRDFERAHDTRLTYRVIGERVALLVGRDAPFNPTSVRAWFVEGQEPDSLAVTAALAVVLDTDRDRLAFGENGLATTVGVDWENLTEAERRAFAARLAAEPQHESEA